MRVLFTMNQRAYTARIKGCGALLIDADQAAKLKAEVGALPGGEVGPSPQIPGTYSGSVFVSETGETIEVEGATHYGYLLGVYLVDVASCKLSHADAAIKAVRRRIGEIEAALDRCNRQEALLVAEVMLAELRASKPWKPERPRPVVNVQYTLHSSPESYSAATGITIESLTGETIGDPEVPLDVHSSREEVGRALKRRIKDSDRALGILTHD